jgi:hypothetical protein
VVEIVEVLEEQAPLEATMQVPVMLVIGIDVVVK